ncbi:MAG: DUF2066 domain-containing protein [Gammaproteobacteria bacterium]|nr:DUF2066 domain-containing protein [Gammaproteobacteria bacterium]
MIPSMLPRVIIALCLLSASIVAHAAETNAFQAFQPVSDRSKPAQDRAMLQAFKEILVRASGTRRALDAFYVQESYKKVSSFVRTFEYREVEVNDNGQSKDQLMLVVTFDRVAVRRLLQDSSVPMWGGRIPVTLIWLAYEDNYERKVVTAEKPESSTAGELLVQQVQRRGLPLVLPLMDLEDTMIVRPSDIWGRFSSPIGEASQRYGSEAVMAGRLVETSGQWEAKVMLDINGRQILQDFSSSSQQGTVDQMIDWLGESLCDVYCVTETYTSNNQWKLIVKDVGSFYSYRSLLNYLEKLPAIRKVEMSSVKARNAMVTVDLVGDVQALKQAINLDRKLVLVDDPQEVRSVIEFMASDSLNANQSSLPGNNPNTSGVDSGSTQTVVPEIANQGAPVETAQPMGQQLPQSVEVTSEKREQNILVYRWRP